MVDDFDGDVGSDSDLDVFIEMQTSLRPPERAIEVRVRERITSKNSRPDLGQIGSI